MAILYFRIKIGEVKRKLFSIKIIINIKNIRRINEKVKIYFIILSFIRTLVTKVSTTMKKLDASITQSINCKYIQNLFSKFFNISYLNYYHFYKHNYFI